MAIKSDLTTTTKKLDSICNCLRCSSISLIKATPESHRQRNVKSKFWMCFIIFPTELSFCLFDESFKYSRNSPKIPMRQKLTRYLEIKKLKNIHPLNPYSLEGSRWNHIFCQFQSKEWTLLNNAEQRMNLHLGLSVCIFVLWEQNTESSIRKN